MLHHAIADLAAELAVRSSVRIPGTNDSLANVLAASIHFQERGRFVISVSAWRPARAIREHIIVHF